MLLHDLDPAWESAEIATAVEGVQRLEAELRHEGHPVIAVPVTNDGLAKTLQPYRPDNYVVFNWCEGLPGRARSEHMVARILESLNFAYTGACPEVLAFSWDKAASKELLNRSGIPTPAGMVLHPDEAGRWSRFPAIVKPSLEHCSLGISADAVVMDRRKLKERIDFMRENFNQPALVEDFIDGREFHVTLWGNGNLHALPAAEMDFSAFNNIKDRLCTFDSKFTPGSLPYEKIELRIPAVLDETERKLLNQTAVRAFKVMGCRDYARIDIRLENGIYYVLDINPNPDFSPDTSSILAAEASGLSYGAFASCLVNLAARRHPVYSIE